MELCLPPYIHCQNITFMNRKEINANIGFASQRLCCEVKVAQSWLSVKVKVPLLDPMDYTVHGILQARILEWVAFPFSRGFSQPRDWTQVSLITGGFLTSWAIRKLRNTWAGSLSLLQGIFMTQELNWGLLHCRWIFYQMSYQGSLNNAYRCVNGIVQLTKQISLKKNIVLLPPYIAFTTALSFLILLSLNDVWSYIRIFLATYSCKNFL